MADAPNTATYLTRTDERTASNLPNALQLVGSTTIGLSNIGGGQYRIAAIGTVANLNNLSSNGFVTFNASSQTFAGTTLTSNGTIGITNPTGVGGNAILSVTPNTTNQKVQALKSGTPYSTRKGLNFIPGQDTSITIVDDGVNDRANITIASTLPTVLTVPRGGTGLSSVAANNLLLGNGTNALSTLAPGTSGYVLTSNGAGAAPTWQAGGGGGGGAPTDAYYLVSQANGTLSNEVNLGLLSSGVLFSTVSSSVSTVSSITPGASGTVLTSNGAGSAPTWQSAGSGSLGPTLTTINGLTIAAGDMLVGSGSNAMTNLAKGSNSTFLGVNSSGVIGWNALPGILPNLGTVTGTTTGSLLVGNGSGTFTNFAVSSTANQVVSSNGTTLAWATVANRSAKYLLQEADASLPNAQDLSAVGVGPLNLTAGVVGAITPGSSGTVLTSTGTGTQPTWQVPTAYAPLNGTYVTTTNMTGTLSNSVNLGGLTTGLLFGTVASGTSTVTSTIGSSGTVPYSTGSGVTWRATPVIQHGVATLTAGANPTVAVSASSISTSPESTIVLTPIFVGAPVSGNVLTPYASNYSAGVGFTIGVYGTIASDLKVSWMVMN
jgi:hypothetical protein